MKVKKLLTTVIAAIILMGITICLWEIVYCYKQRLSEVPIKLEQPEFFLLDSPSIPALYECLAYYDIHHPDIVVSQAILETGEFRSRVCKENNNLFGLYNSHEKKFIKFKHWTESVEAYKKYIQRKYKSEEDYYKFLKRIKYAEDSLYNGKVKSLTKKLQDKNND